ncbi:MAG: rhodanese-like domain-containing protein [Bacteriovoracaceae bacterium]|nr:rhodanese-like domain-containing protein [Bacteriovoracaceae bacterium]
MSHISIHDLHDELKTLKEGEVILDVRTPAEYAESHIPNSININHENVLSHVEELKKYKKVYIHCRRGGRATHAFNALSSAGLTNLVCVSDGGMDIWCECDYPIVK